MSVPGTAANVSTWCFDAIPTVPGTGPHIPNAREADTPAPTRPPRSGREGELLTFNRGNERGLESAARNQQLGTSAGECGEKPLDLFGDLVLHVDAEINEIRVHQVDRQATAGIGEGLDRGGDELDPMQQPQSVTPTEALRTPFDLAPLSLTFNLQRSTPVA